MRGMCQPSGLAEKLWEFKPVVYTTGRGCADPPGLNAQRQNCECGSYILGRPNVLYFRAKGPLIQPVGRLFFVLGDFGDFVDQLLSGMTFAKSFPEKFSPLRFLSCPR